MDLWRTAIVNAGGDPFAALAEALFAGDALGAELRAGDFSDPHALAGLFEGGGPAALVPIRSALARAAQARKEALRYEEARPARLFIALDQVERLFVEVEPERVEAFAKLAARAGRGRAWQPSWRCCAAMPTAASRPFRRSSRCSNRRARASICLPPSRTELEEIVTRPVAACYPPLAYEIDAQGRSLAEALVADAHGGDALPLLQMTLQRLFDAEAARGDGVLRFGDYPGIGAAVMRMAEEAVAGLDASAVPLLPALITAFVRDVTFAPTAGSKR